MPARPARKAAAALPPASPEDLAAAVREALASKPGLKGSELEKALPKPLQAQHAEALAVLRELVAKGEAFRHAKAKVERFFAADPVATLDRVVPALLSRGEPLAAPDLKKVAEREARGHGGLVAEWLKSALARRVVFEHAPLPKSRAKRYASEPDVARLLAKTFAELRKALAHRDATSVPRERIAEAIRKELGLATPPADATLDSAAVDRETLRASLRRLASEHRPGTLLLVHDLRARTPLDKERFDAAALALAREGAAVLHHHDHAASLEEDERRQLVADGRGTHYVGIAPRTPT